MNCYVGCFTSRPQETANTELTVDKSNFGMDYFQMKKDTIYCYYWYCAGSGAWKSDSDKKLPGKKHLYKNVCKSFVRLLQAC